MHSSHHFLNYHSCLGRAKKLVNERLKFFNRHYNFLYKKVAVKRQKTRWGSCSSKKQLNFNYRILFLPEHLADYVIVHEICHLQEMNHSHRFWMLVKQTIPDAAERKIELRGHKLSG